MANPVNLAALISSTHPAVEIINGKPATTSVEVARVFQKRHDHVLRDIEKLRKDLPAEHAPNFGEMSIEVDIGNGATRASKVYRFTRDSFTMLAFGFTGKKATAFKAAYISAFNRMEQELQGKAAATENNTAAQQPELSFDPTDAGQLQSARKAALDYFNKARAAIRTGGAWPTEENLEDILRGILANALTGRQWLVHFSPQSHIGLSPAQRNTLGELAKRISNGDLPASNEELLQLGQACREKLMQKLALPKPDSLK